MRAALFAVLLAAMAVQQTPAPGAGSIGGVVIKAGTVIEQPLDNARVEISRVEAGGARVARTNARGEFVFSGLLAGTYRISLTRDGFIRQTSPKPIVLRAGDNVRDIVFRLEPAPVVSGWVQDPFGEPIPNILIEALRKTYDFRGNPTFTRIASALTDDLGEYRIYWIDPGEYYFFATSAPPETDGNAPPPNVVVPTYFPGVTDSRDARVVRVNLGREVGGIDFRLNQAPTYRVIGFISDPITGLGNAAITLTRPQDDPNQTRYQTRSTKGAFGISQPVAPGTYIVRALGEKNLIGLQRIFLRPGGIFYDIRMALTEPLTWNGRFFLEGGKVDMSELSISLISTDPDFPSSAVTRPRQDGEFSIQEIIPGDFVIDVADLPDDLYVKAARFGDLDPFEQPVLLDRITAQAPLQVLLGVDGGRLTVAVFDRQNQPLNGATVVLVPEVARRHRREAYRAGLSDEGVVVLRGIAPGRYKLFAWETLEQNAYLNADFVRLHEELGTAVEVRSGEMVSISVRAVGE